MRRRYIFPEYIFSPKELRDLKRRVRVAKMLGAGETWKEIKRKTGAHLQTIAIVSKRLSGVKRNSKKKINRKALKSPIFSFG